MLGHARRGLQCELGVVGACWAAARNGCRGFASASSLPRAHRTRASRVQPGMSISIGIRALGSGIRTTHSSAPPPPHGAVAGPGTWSQRCGPATQHPTAIHHRLCPSPLAPCQRHVRPLPAVSARRAAQLHFPVPASSSAAPCVAHRLASARRKTQPMTCWRGRALVPARVTLCGAPSKTWPLPSDRCDPEPDSPLDALQTGDRL